jgi:hypothetical protein
LALKVLVSQISAPASKYSCTVCRAELTEEHTFFSEKKTGTNRMNIFNDGGAGQTQQLVVTLQRLGEVLQAFHYKTKEEGQVRVCEKSRGREGHAKQTEKRREIDGI